MGEPLWENLCGILSCGMPYCGMPYCGVPPCGIPSVRMVCCGMISNGNDDKQGQGSIKNLKRCQGEARRKVADGEDAMRGTRSEVGGRAGKSTDTKQSKVSFLGALPGQWAGPLDSNDYFHSQFM